MTDTTTDTARRTLTLAGVVFTEENAGFFSSPRRDDGFGIDVWPLAEPGSDGETHSAMVSLGRGVYFCGRGVGHEAAVIAALATVDNALGAIAKHAPSLGRMRAATIRATARAARAA